jgi:hypothetical protein
MCHDTQPKLWCAKNYVPYIVAYLQQCSILKVQRSVAVMLYVRVLPIIKQEILAFSMAFAIEIIREANYSQALLKIK